MSQATLSRDFAVAITPSDVTSYPQGVQVYVGGAGNVAITDMIGNVVTFTAPPVGSLLPVRATKVMATNTTATLLVGCY
jgi:hypothetical protein